MVLEQSQLWGCGRTREIAIRELQHAPLDNVVKIAAWNKFGLDETELTSCYHALAVQTQPISLEEGQLMGMPLLIKLMALRDAVNHGVMTYLKDTCGGLDPGHMLPLEFVKDLVCRSLLGDFMRTRA